MHNTLATIQLLHLSISGHSDYAAELPKELFSLLLATESQNHHYMLQVQARSDKAHRKISER